MILVSMRSVSRFVSSIDYKVRLHGTEPNDNLKISYRGGLLDWRSTAYTVLDMGRSAHMSLVTVSVYSCYLPGTGLLLTVLIKGPHTL